MQAKASVCLRSISVSNTRLSPSLLGLSRVVVLAAVWTLSLKILYGRVLTGGLDPSGYPVSTRHAPSWKALHKRRYGRIINLVAAIGTALPGNAFYAAKKAEAIILTRRFAMGGPTASP